MLMGFCFKERVFPYCSGVAEPSSPSSAASTSASSSANPADFLLSCVARATCEAYQTALLRINTLTANSAKQLATDIGKIGFENFFLK